MFYYSFRISPRVCRSVSQNICRLRLRRQSVVPGVRRCCNARLQGIFPNALANNEAAEGACTESTETNVFKILRERGLLESCTSENVAEQSTQEPLRVYCGFDPTADSLHIGNLLGIIVLSWFQKYGHVPIALIGGATGRVGDPSGKSTERPILDESTIVTNGQAIEGIIRNILSNEPQGRSSLMVVNNIEWYSTMSFLDFLRDVGKFARLGTMLAKDSVKSRLASENGISFTEFSYQLLQGYDFVHLFRHHQVSVQIGGSDQWGNITAGTDLLRRLEPGASVYGLTFPLLLKSDGTKFGKSEQGAIWLSPSRLSPYKFYQYFLGVEDADVIRLLRMLTFLPISEIIEIERTMTMSGYVINAAQKKLAEELTLFVHGAQGLKEAQAATDILRPGTVTELDAHALLSLVGLVPSAQLPIAEVVGQNLIDVVVKVGLLSSKSATKRLIEGGGLRMNNIKVTTEDTIITEPDLVDGTLLLISSGKKNKLLLMVQR